MYIILFSASVIAVVLTPTKIYINNNDHICSAKYRGHGTDLSKVDQFERHENDTGSPEAQVARLTARVEQLTAHLKIHSKDYSTRRGLMRILSKRKQMLIYLRDNDKATYERCLQGLGIRQLKSEI